MKRLVLTCLLVARLAAADADSSYTAAKNAFDAAQFELAASQFELFVKSFPDDPRVGAAAMFWLDSLSRPPLDQARFDRAVEELVRVPSIHGADRNRVLALNDQLQRQRAEALTDAKHYAEAATIFADLAKLEPAPTARADEWFNAGVMFEQAHDADHAIAMFHLAAAPANTSAEMIAHALERAVALEELVHPFAAAEDAAKVPPAMCGGKSESCRTAAATRFHAGELFLALGKYKHAAAAFESYGKDFGSQADADRAALLAGHAAELIGDDRKTEAAYATYLKRAHPLQPEFAYLRLGHTAERRGERAKADQAFARAAKLAASRPELATIAGEAKLALADGVARDAAAVKLTVPAKKLVAALKERSRLVEAAQSAYDDVATAHDSYWMIAALDHAAKVYDDFASALLAATPPPLESDADKLSYRHQIELFASGVTNRVIDGYRAAYDTGLATDIHSEHVIDARRQLARLDPKTYPPEREAREGLRVEPAFVPRILTGLP